jgi:CRP/FNR family transcriptional regulator, cyclic AMP receptor protein
MRVSGPGGTALRSSLAHNGPVTNMLELCADLPTEHVAAGEVLIAESSTPNRMLVLVSGTVLVERDGTPFARIDFPGAVFGEMSWILDKPATATARAATDVVVHVVSDPDQFFIERPGAALSVLQMTAGRLDGLTQYLVDVKLQFAGNEDHTAMIGRILDSLVHHQAPRPRTGSVRDPEGDHDEH